MAIQVVRVQECWDFISPSIGKIMGDLPWQDFRKEDLYAACANGVAAIFVDTDFPLGDSFFIARIDENESTGERVLFLWVAFSKAPNTAGRVMQSIEKIAQDSECDAIEFITGSEDVMRHGEEFGFDKVLYRCRKEIQRELAAEEGGDS